MVTPLPTASLRLNELFDDPYYFTIPSYQRPYSWAVEQAGQLMEDLIGASGVDATDSADDFYFMGAILLLDTQPANGVSEAKPRQFSIIDGQQRLITLTTIAAALRDLAADEGGNAAANRLVALVTAPTGEGPVRYRMTLRGAEHDFFERHILQPGACTHMPSAEDADRAGERRMLAARERIIEQLMSLTSMQREVLADYICDKCRFVVIHTSDIDHAHRMFTVLNSRGKPLGRDDILKAEVLHAIPAERSAEALALWERAAADLDSKFEDFFSHLRALYGHAKPKVIAGIRAIIRETGDAETFLRNDVAPLARAYHQILTASSHEYNLAPTVRDPLIRLNRFKSGADWIPAAIAVLRDHADNPEHAGMLLCEIERLAYLIRFLCMGSAKRTARFAPVIQALRSGEPLGPESAVFEIKRDENKLINYFLRDFYKRSQQSCKHILMRLEDELSGTTSLLAPAQVSVEHVLPQNPSASSVWRQWHPIPERRDICTKSLGNFTLLSKRQNDRARNKEFARKQDVYASPDDGMPILALTRDLLGVEVWDEHHIRERERRLKAILERIWRIDLGSSNGAEAETGDTPRTTAMA